MHHDVLNYDLYDRNDIGITEITGSSCLSEVFQPVLDGGVFVGCVLHPAPLRFQLLGNLRHRHAGDYSR